MVIPRQRGDVPPAEKEETFHRLRETQGLPRARSERAARRYGSRLLIELLVVFFGVFLGLLANDMAQRREQAKRNEQVYRGLAREISVFVNAVPGVIAYADSLMSDWNLRYAAGERPTPVPFRLEGIDAPPRGMWDAVLATGAIATGNVDLVASVSEYYNTVESAVGKYQEVKAFGDREILPFLDTPEHFYAPDGTLRPVYRQHMHNLVDMRQTMAATLHGGAEMRRLLVQQLRPPPERPVPHDLFDRYEGTFRFEAPQLPGIGEPDTARVFRAGDSLVYVGATHQRLLYQGLGTFLLADEPEVRIVFSIRDGYAEALVKEGRVGPGRSGRAARIR
jgi:hypothetical protein